MFGQQDDVPQPQNTPWVTDVSPAPTGDAPQPQMSPANDQVGNPQQDSVPAVSDQPGSDPGSPALANDDLLNIKQQALQQLSPLVGQLDQSPEEKFRTTMMMIQATDDQSLVSTAYEAANQIRDPKERAQALLDIVNEINYFTQSRTNQ